MVVNESKSFRFQMTIDITAKDEEEARLFLSCDINGLSMSEILDAEKWEVASEDGNQGGLDCGIVSAEKKQQYIDRDGVQCPFCGSLELDADGPSVEQYSDVVFDIVTCNSCGKTWKDIYKIVDIVECDDDEDEIETTTAIDETIDTVGCKFCRKNVPATTAHLHENEWVGECCWDERLRSSE